jgi:acyl-coenzyme A thioesterase PaaI-like protein
MMTLLDFAMAMAAKVKHGHLGGAMTIDMSTSFIKGGKGKMVVHGTVLKAGKSIQFCEASAYDASGDLLAKSMGTFKLVEFR